MKCSQEYIDHTLKNHRFILCVNNGILVAKIAGILTFTETLTCILSLPSKLCFTKELVIGLGDTKEHSFENGSSKKRYSLMEQARILLSFISRAPRIPLPHHFHSVCKLKRGGKAHCQFLQLSLSRCSHLDCPSSSSLGTSKNC